MTDKIKETLKSYLIITFGALLMACGIYFFKFPNNFSTGGVSALSILLSPFIKNFTTAQIMLFFNIMLLIVGILVFGKNFAFKTVYCSVLLSLFTRLFEVILPMATPFTDQKLLELIYSIGITALGSAIIFNENASSGGTDIVAMILKKVTNLDIGKALLCSDFVLALASGFIFGMETCLLSIAGLIMKAFVVDNVIDGIHLSKCFFIVTTKSDEIANYINTELHRGATVSHCVGAFTGDSKELIITVLKRGQAFALKQYIKSVDPKAFTIITSSSDIFGKGFRTV